MNWENTWLNVWREYLATPNGHLFAVDENYHRIINDQLTVNLFKEKPMGSITLKSNLTTPVGKPARDIAVGKPFAGRIGQHRSTFVRAYGDIIINLADPRYTWGVNPDVQEFEYVNVTITVNPIAPPSDF